MLEPFVASLEFNQCEGPPCNVLMNNKSSGTFVCGIQGCGYLKGHAHTPGRKHNMHTRINTHVNMTHNALTTLMHHTHTHATYPCVFADAIGLIVYQAAVCVSSQRHTCPSHLVNAAAIITFNNTPLSLNDLFVYVM